MKVIFITPVVPFVDGGTSAHIYHLLLGRENDVTVDIFTFNNNHKTDEEIISVENELNVKFHLISMPSWIQWLFKLRLHFVRAFLQYPIFYYLKLDKDCVREIDSMHPDGIWIYGEELACIDKQFPHYRRVHTLPDSEAMFFYRMLQQRFVTNDSVSYWKNVLMYRKYIRLEKAYENSTNITYHLVGQADADFIKNNNPGIDARFIKHPHYQVLDAQREIRFHQPRIRLLIAGQYNYYMQQEADLLSEELIVKSEELAPHYVITFLGKGWERHAKTLSEAGYEVKHVSFAENYQKELVKHDIQITPITIGTGTKGKVLDALANGLLVIGTSYAMENIAVQHGVSCIEYHHPDEVVQALLDISCHIEKYEEMARQGRQQVLTQHGWKVVSDQLFNIFRK